MHSDICFERPNGLSYIQIGGQNQHFHLACPLTPLLNRSVKTDDSQLLVDNKLSESFDFFVTALMFYAKNGRYIFGMYTYIYIYLRWSDRNPSIQSFQRLYFKNFLWKRKRATQRRSQTNQEQQQQQQPQPQKQQQQHQHQKKMPFLLLRKPVRFLLLLERVFQIYRCIFRIFDLF